MTNPSTQLPPISEKQFQAQVIQLAMQLGWKEYHPWLSVRSREGWPDLVLCRPPRLVFAELKKEAGQVTPSQRKWLAALEACGDEVYVWRPSQIEEIARVLR